MIADLIENSHDAFNAIYEMYAKRLYAYCLQYAKSAEDTEDIVQGVFVKLWINRRNIKNKTTLKPLLFAMSRNALIDAYRHRLFSPIYEEFVEYKQSITIETYRHVEYQDFVMQIEKILKGLSDTQQKVIRLSKFQGMRNSDIAEELSISEQTVKNALSTGMKYLRSRLRSLMTFLGCCFLINI